MSVESLNGWRYPSPRHRKKCIGVTAVSWAPSKSSFSSPHKHHFHLGLCVSAKSFLSTPLRVRGPDLVLRVESFILHPSQVISWVEITITSLFSAQHCGMPTLQGLQQAIIMTVIIKVEKTLLSLPACSSDGSDGVQPPICLPPGQASNWDVPWIRCSSAEICRHHALLSCLCCVATLLQLRGQVPRHGTEIRMLSPSWESGSITRTPASQSHSPPLYPLSSLHAPFMGQAWTPAVDVPALGLGGEAMALDRGGGTSPASARSIFPAHLPAGKHASSGTRFQAMPGSLLLDVPGRTGVCSLSERGKKPVQGIQAGVWPLTQPLQALVPCALQESLISGVPVARDGADVQVAAIRGSLWRDKQSVLPQLQHTLLCQWLWRAQRGRELGGKLNWPDGDLLWKQPCCSGRRRNAHCSQQYQPVLLACVQLFR